MNIQIPDFLLEMSEQLNTQDNRITAEPIWQVCYDEKRVTDDDYHEFVEYGIFNDEGFEIIFSDERGSEYDEDYCQQTMLDRFPEYCKRYEEETEYAFDHFDISNEWCDLPGEIKRLFMKREKVVIRSCLTEADANFFIKRKQHDYPEKLYTYVDTMNYCPQMIELRNWIKGLNSN